ncbi:MAG: hypothetical protein ABI588_06400 [Arenimonas sp.]
MKIRVMFAAALLCAASSAAEAKVPVLASPVAQELPVEVMLWQHEIAIDTPDNSAVASQFGLIGALIGAAVSNAQASAAERRVADIRNLLVDYDFNARVEQALRAKIASEGISPAPKLTILDTPWDAYLERSSQAMTAAAAAGNAPATGTVMKITPKYALSYTMQQMYMSLDVSLVNRIRKPNGKYKEKWITMKNYRFEFPLDPGYGVNADINSRRWQAVGRAGMERMLDLAVAQTTDMMVYDFSTAGRAEGARKLGRKESGRFKDLKTFGRQLREGDDWYWVRARPVPYVWATIKGVSPLRGMEQGPDLAPANATAPASVEAPATGSAAAAAGALN